MARQGIMLAHKIDERKLKGLGKMCFAQPKLNGMRAWTKWRPTILDLYEPSLISSGGNDIAFFDHVKEELELLNLIRGWDGEIYEHGMAFEDIMSIARRTVNNKAGMLPFHIFDVKGTLPQYMRVEELEHTKKLINDLGLKYVKIVPTYAILTDTWEDYLHMFLEQGYEGIILRKWDGHYRERKCNELLKYKARDNYPYTIVAILQGEGWCYDRCGSILVADRNGVEFAVGSGRILTAGGRLDIWNRRKELVGKVLIVRHERKVTETINGKPRGCNAWEIIEE